MIYGLVTVSGVEAAALRYAPVTVRQRIGKGRAMGAVLLLLLLALVFGGVGLFVEGLKWALIVALALVVVGPSPAFALVRWSEYR